MNNFSLIPQIRHFFSDRNFILFGTHIKQIWTSSEMTMLLLVLFSIQPLQGQDLLTVYEKSNHLETSTYRQGIDFYKQLAANHEEVQLFEKGLTDSGYPLHLVYISKSGEFDIAKLKREKKAFLLINNAIHSGEPDGVEASQLLARNLVENKELNKLLDHTVVVIIPFFNIGGVLNRNSTTRVNQNGPLEYGFRGNARNYDLNRDFIKADTRNGRSFMVLFQELDPDLFIDTHVSNGADYQYISTNVSTQVDKLGGELARFLKEDLLPFHYNFMKKKGTEMIPYVNVWGLKTPDLGYSEFIDYPRYSSGYAALFHTLSFMSETHMLKTFEQRVTATYNYLLGLLTFTSENAQQLIEIRTRTKEKVASQTEFPITWKLNEEIVDTILFKGFEATKPISKISGQVRLKYDRNKPYEKRILYFNHYKADITVSKPDFYVIPKSQWKILEVLRLNGIQIDTVKFDKTIEVEAYYITSYQTRKDAYEGHYPHSEAELEAKRETVLLEKDDFLIAVNQWRNRYIIETLEPQATDSFFNWNFFDTILQRKEDYSAYVFEDLAIRILEENPAIKKALEEKKENNSEFAIDGNAQLTFIYAHSMHGEKAFMRYPILRYTLPKK